MKMEPIEGSKTLAIINQTPGNYLKGNLLYSVHGESLKSRIKISFRNIVRVHAMKAYGRSRGTSPLILNLCTGWR